MEYRKLGHSDLEVSAITFGAWAAGGWMWGSTDRNEAIEAIRASYELGVTSMDTAPIYGQGTSEEIVGEAIKGISRDKVQILTKFGMRWDLDKGTLAMQSKNNDGKDIDIYKYAGLFYSYTSPVADVFFSTCNGVEQRGFPRVRIACQCNFHL